MAFADMVVTADLAVRRLLGGETVFYRTTTSAPRPILGIFDRSYLVTDSDGHIGIETVVPALFVRTSDLPSDFPTEDPIITARDVDYNVIDRKTDSIGGTLLILGRVE